eukprot:5830425-Prymnesium_polylepis.1
MGRSPVSQRLTAPGAHTHPEKSEHAACPSPAVPLLHCPTPQHCPARATPVFAAQESMASSSNPNATDTRPTPC